MLQNRQEATIVTAEAMQAEAARICTVGGVLTVNFILCLILLQAALLTWEFLSTPQRLEVRDDPAWFWGHMALIAATVLFAVVWARLLRKQMKFVAKKKKQAVEIKNSAVEAIKRHLEVDFDFCEGASLEWGQLRLLVFSRLKLKSVNHEIVRIGGTYTNQDAGTGLLGNKVFITIELRTNSGRAVLELRRRASGSRRDGASLRHGRAPPSARGESRGRRRRS